MDEGTGKTHSHALGANGWPIDGLGPQACTLDMRRQVLAAVPYFSALEPSELERVHASFHAVAMAAGETLVSEGDPAERFCVIASGRVKLNQSTAVGGQHLLDVLGPGASFGELPLLGQAHNAFGAEALTSGCLLVTSAEEFGELVSAFPKVALAVLEDVSAKLRDAQSRLRSSAGAVPVEARLASALLMLSARLGQPDGEGRTLGAPLSQEDLAAMTGSTLETVNRVLAQWRKGKIVTTGRRRLSIIDVPALAAISEAGK
ncbi:MAG TPA: Crp/Fnr family transcriptional regulator [Trueperaceae bacterium]|nr:Crp/Fnr family transcriptional regulator [Trueperaceae bacterium]